MILRRMSKSLGLCLLAGFLLLSFSAGADLLDQPDTNSSCLVPSSGGYIYDWQLANMIKMWVADAGYANMIFIFNQCFAGGMIDDLKEKLSGTGDVALMGAARHDETSKGLEDTFTATDQSRLAGFERPEDLYAKEIGEEMARSGNDAPTARQMADNAASQDLMREGGKWVNGAAWPAGVVEHPQSTMIGNGGAVKIGKKADGSDVASKHAILFAGDADGMRHWNDVDRAYKALTDKHGFSPENVVVLVGGGKNSKKPDGSNAPGYVDGPGTKKALFGAIEALRGKMNANEQFIFWASDHGDMNRTEVFLEKAIRDPVKQTVPPRRTASPPGAPSWDLDTEFLDAMLEDPDNEPFVSLIVCQAFNLEYANDLAAFLNSEQLELRSVEPIYAYDDEPDLDGYELLFPIPDEEMLTPENLIEVEWQGDPEQFQPFTILALQIGTGSINTVPEETPLPGEEKSITIPDPLDDLYRRGGYPTGGRDWQDITEVEVTRTDEKIEFRITVNGVFPRGRTFKDGVFMILLDINGDGRVVPSKGPIDFYRGNFDYGIFISSPEFGEPPIFIENLRLGGRGRYVTSGVEYSIEGNKIVIVVELSQIGDPEGTIWWVVAVKRGIERWPPVEDRVPNEGLAETADP